LAIEGPAGGGRHRRDGTRERKLTSEDALTFHDIEWSPDGRSITCVGNAGGRGFSIQRIDVASGARNQLTDGTFQDARPTESPDGAWILFESWRVGSRAEADLFVMPSSGGAAVRLDTRAGAAGDACSDEIGEPMDDDRGRRPLTPSPHPVASRPRVARR